MQDIYGQFSILKETEYLPRGGFQYGPFNVTCTSSFSLLNHVVYFPSSSPPMPDTATSLTPISPKDSLVEVCHDVVFYSSSARTTCFTTFFRFLIKILHSHSIYSKQINTALCFRYGCYMCIIGKSNKIYLFGEKDKY